MLGKEMNYQPPSLNTMVRARLAVTHFGLEKVLKTPVQELLSEVYPSNFKMVPPLTYTTSYVALVLCIDILCHVFIGIFHHNGAVFLSILLLPIIFLP